MKLEEAMVYLLATSQHGMKTEQIARELELRGLVPRRVGKPLDGKVIAAIVFKHPEVDISQFKVSQFLRFCCYELELCLIIASSHPMDIQIKYGVVHLLHDTLRSSQYGSVVIQKVYPVMDIHPMGFLV